MCKRSLVVGHTQNAHGISEWLTSSKILLVKGIFSFSILGWFSDRLRYWLHRGPAPAAVGTADCANRLVVPASGGGSAPAPSGFPVWDKQNITS